MNLKKILVMKTPPEISDQEIHAMMDFDKVLDIHRQARKKTRLFISAGVIGGGVIAYLILSQVVGTPEPETKPVVQDSIAIKTEKKIEPVAEPIVSTPEKKTPPTTIKKEEPKPLEPKPSTEATQTYAEAEPVDGYPNLYAYFQRELKYPAEAVKDSVEGIVSVSFVINREGKPEQIKILNSLGAAFDQEAIRVVTGMPQWKSATLNDKPVPARISMPLTFQIDKIQKQ